MSLDKIRLFCLIFLLSVCLSCKGETDKDTSSVVFDDYLPALEIETFDYPKGYFLNPMYLPITLSGSFAELRGSHFHSGIDIRTKERTGYVVIAPSDGYVSRIKVQAYGGGKNLYISHPNGYTTVYMHLDKYYGKIESFVKQYQYKNKTFTFDYLFNKPSIYVRKGDTIAISGQSGMVQGPHLHFEIRDTKTECPINPLLFGFNLPDTIKPNILSLAITPVGEALVEGNPFSKIINLKDTSFHQADTVEVANEVYFSILAYDASEGSTSKNGVYKTELFVDTTLIFSHHVENFSFANYSHVDATINYPLYISTGKRYLSSRKLDGAFLPFNYYKNNGVLNVMQDSVYRISWRLSDLKGNVTLYYFYVKGIENKVNKPSNPKAMKFAYIKDNVFLAKDSSMFFFAKGSLYEDIDFTSDMTNGKYSNIHTVYNIYEPVKKSFTIKIKPYKIDKRLKDKYLVVRLNDKGYKTALSSKVVDGYVQATSSSFGKFTVWIDTIAPQIKSVNFKNKKTLKRKQKTLKVRITDNLSGINTYNAYLNGKWVLMEFDGKNALLTYYIDKDLKQGKNTLKLIVTDVKNNVASKVFTIYKP